MMPNLQVPYIKITKARLTPEAMRSQLIRTASPLVLMLAVVWAWPGSLRAQNAPAELRVASYVLPPFVIKDGDQLTGFSIDLWQEIAMRLNARLSYQILPDVDTCIEAVRSNNADIGVSAFFYTKQRDMVIDYTYSTLNAGLGIMVRGRAGSEVGRVRPLPDWFALMFSQSAGIWLVATLIIIIIPAHLAWLFDRGNEDGVSPTKRYFPGIFHSLFWAFTVLLSQGQTMPKNWFARFLAGIWMFAGVIFVALYTAQLAALLTAEQIRGSINGPSDLPGKQIGTVVSTAADYLRRINADVRVFPSTDKMFQALIDSEIDAVVLDAPVLDYYATHQGRGRVTRVGSEFDKNDLGFVVALGSPLRKRVSNQLLALHEDGTYQRIYAKWFGSE